MNSEKRMIIKPTYMLLLILLTSIHGNNAKAQISEKKLDFLKLEHNKIINESALISVFEKLRNRESISIIHIGDSHIQADMFTGKIRNSLMHYFNCDSSANRGNIFPYSIAQSNEPDDYAITLNGSWKFENITKATKETEFGFQGINLKSTTDSLKLKLKLHNKNIHYQFSKIAVQMETSGQIIKIKSDNQQIAEYSKKEDFVEVTFSEPITEVNLHISFNKKSKLILKGILLLDKKCPINYYTIGHNGARAQHYLTQPDFLKSLNHLNPDLIILSLGTNDVYDKDVNLSKIKEHFHLLLKELSIISNSILICSPADHMIQTKESNPNLALLSDFLKTQAGEKIAFWDFNKLMGGEGSIMNWHEEKLAYHDLIHFTKAGYWIQSDLFIQTFLHHYERYINGNN